MCSMGHGPSLRCFMFAFTSINSTNQNRMQLKTIQLLFLSFFLLPLKNPSSAQSFNEDEQEDVKKSHFPDGFLFGTSTSSYQVEGAYLQDGKGLNNWDVFSHVPGKIKNNDNGDIADNHYYRFLEDIELMHSLGVDAYRFSVSWARILPRGKFGEVNPRGIMFYNTLIDHLLLRGIQPFVTIHHHDIPHELEDRYGGWLSPLMQEDLLYFAEICFKSFGDRVKYWITINEPNLVADMAYTRGWYPPAHCSPPFGNCSVGNSDIEPLIVMHNMILGHAKVVKLYRESFQLKQGGSIGIVANTQMFEPLRDIEQDQQAAIRALAYANAWLFDPLVYGDYPAVMRYYLGRALPRFSPKEISYVKGSLDFIGINHYQTLYTQDCIHSACIPGGDRAVRGFVYTTGERDGVLIGGKCGNPRFFVVPDGMEKTINYLKERYNNMPMFVTENGFSPPQQNEQVQELLQDTNRVNYHKSYLAALARAIRNGADVRGYFVWSLVDNFEWIDGYNMPYGLYYVDRQTLERVPKLSAMWYKHFLTDGTSHSSEEDFPVRSFKNKNVTISGLEAAKSVI